MHIVEFEIKWIICKFTDKQVDSSRRQPQTQTASVGFPQQHVQYMNMQQIQVQQQQQDQINRNLDMGSSDMPPADSQQFLTNVQQNQMQMMQPQQQIGPQPGMFGNMQNQQPLQQQTAELQRQHQAQQLARAVFRRYPWLPHIPTVAENFD